MRREGDGTIVLAQSPEFGAITMCSCGVVRMQLGAVTIRLEGTALLKVEQMIQNALDSLCEIAAENGMEVPLSAHVQ